MKPPIELSRPTALNIAAIICYCLAMLFNIIAYATANWSSLLLEGVRWRMGLWYGCREYSNGTEVCSTDVFNDKVFQSGMSSDWHIGSQVMMTLALITLFLLEFAVIGYACIKSLERYKAKVVGLILGLSVTSGICTLVTVCLYGSGATRDPEAQLGWSFGIVLLSFVFQIICPGIIAFDLYKTRLSGKMMRKSTECINTVAEPPFGNTNTVVDIRLDDLAF